MNKSIKELYGLNSKQQKEVIEIYKKITGKKETKTEMDCLFLQKIIQELSSN